MSESKPKSELQIVDYMSLLPLPKPAACAYPIQVETPSYELVKKYWEELRSMVDCLIEKLRVPPACIHNHDSWTRLKAGFAPKRSKRSPKIWSDAITWDVETAPLSSSAKTLRERCMVVHYGTVYGSPIRTIDVQIERCQSPGLVMAVYLYAGEPAVGSR